MLHEFSDFVLATSRNSPTETVREITTDNQHVCAVLP